MELFEIIIFGIMVITAIITLSFSIIDFVKQKKVANKIPISFLIPCYNDGDSVGETIKGIYDVCNKLTFEVLIVNDKSKDNSLEILKELKKKYSFTLINNEKNLGKAKSLNNLSELAKYDTLFVIDADTILSKKVLYDLMARISKKNVAAVSAPYKPRNKSFIAKMQEIEYHFLSFLLVITNIFSTMSLWGGCILIKKEAFKKAGKFSVNAIIEDMDLAIKLNEHGYKVEQSFFPIETYVPDTIKSLYNQKIRWTSGGAQCIVKHYKTYLKKPLYVILIAIIVILGLTYVILTNNGFALLINILKIILFAYMAILLYVITSTVYLTIFSVKMHFYDRLKKIFQLWYIIPFGLIYYPILIIVSIMGFIVGFIKYKSLEEGTRAW